MKERIISILLVACLLISMLPFGVVFADERDQPKATTVTSSSEKAESSYEFSRSTNSYNSEQLTSLSVGDVVILTANAIPVELDGLYKRDYSLDRIDPRDPTADTATCGHGATYLSSPMGQYPLIIEAGAVAGSFAFRVPEGYYLSLPGDWNYLSFSDAINEYSSWRVSFDEEKNAIIENVCFESRLLKWNKSASIFRCYKEALTPYPSVQLYRCTHSSYVSTGELGHNTWNSDSIDNIDKELSITVLANREGSEEANEDYVLCDEATVSYGAENYKTNENGFVSFAYDGGAVSVHKDGYVSRTFSEAALKKSKTIYLQQESKDYPVISGLWMNDVDIIHSEYAVPFTNSGNYTVYTEISWGNKAAGSVKLMQGGASIEIKDGTATFAWSDYFDVNKDIEIVATSKDGATSRKKLKLTAEYALPASLEGFEVNFGDSLSFTLPDSAGDFFGGTKVSAGIYSMIPVEFTIEDGKVYAAIGFQKDYTSKDGKEWNAKTFSASVKDVFKKAADGIDDYQLYQSIQKKLGGVASKLEGSFGFNTGWTIIGFAEGYLTPEGGVRWLDTGMVVGGNVSVGYSFPFYLGPVPMFFESKLSASVEAKVNLDVAEEARQFTPDLHLTGEVALSGGVGVGIKDFLSLSGGIKGKLSPTWDASIGKTDYFQLKAGLSAYAKVAVLFFEYSKDWKLAESVWLEYPERKAAQELSGSYIEFDPYDTANYHPQDLAYLAAGSKFLPLESGFRATSKAAASSTLVGNAYTNAAPQLAAFSDGTMLAVWVGMDASGTYNGLRLYASYYNGSAWSAPKLVDNDGTMDASPVLTVINDVAYLVWQNASKDVSAITELEALAKVMDIGFAAFDKGTQSFSVTHITNGNGSLDMMPQLCGNGNDIYVVWLRNANNDWFGNTSDNSILYRAYTNGAWQAEYIAYRDLDSVVSLAADYDGTELHIAYSLDTDGNLNTSEDLEVYENGVRLTNNALIDSGVQYDEHRLYWYQNGSLVSNSMPMLEGLSSDDYQFVNENGVKAVVYTGQDGLYSTVFASFFDANSGKWGEPIALTDGETNIASFSAAAINGRLEVLLNSIDVVGDYDSEDPYGTANLVLLENALLCDLSIEDIYYDASQFVDGADMTFNLTVKNEGTTASQGIGITISDLQGNELSSANYVDIILSGESKEITCGFAATEAMYGQTVKITVVPLQTEDYDTENNSVTAEINYRDIAVENMAWGVNAAGDIIVYADIVNRSYDSTSNDITVTLRNGSTDTTALETVVIHGLDALSLQRVSFQVDAVDDEAVFYVAISTNSNNDNLANDSDFVVLQTGIDADCQHKYVEEVTAPTCTERGYTTYTCSICGDSYVDSYVSALGHNFVNGVCTRCDANDPNASTKPDIAFEDVPAGAYYEAPVAWAVANGITTGTSATTFRPDNLCTRAQIVTFLWRAYGEPTPEKNENPFADVKEGQYYYDAVLWAVEKGITTGTSANRFGVDDTCTRAQAVTFQWRAAGKPTPENQTNKFVDVKDSAYFYNAVLWAVENGITSGTTATTFRPENGCTRAQIVTFLYRDMAEK